MKDKKNFFESMAKKIMQVEFDEKLTVRECILKNCVDVFNEITLLETNRCANICKEMAEDWKQTSESEYEDHAYAASCCAEAILDEAE